MSRLSHIKQETLVANFLTPWKLKWYFLTEFPSAFWWGLRVRELTTKRCIVSIPYNWRTQNPFRSIYFAALAGAGELSTGALSLAALAGQGSISMLVVNQKAEFYKKASSQIVFICEQGNEVQETIRQVVKSGQAQTITMTSNGYDPNQEVVCQVSITWSFKPRS